MTELDRRQFFGLTVAAGVAMVLPKDLRAPVAPAVTASVVPPPQPDNLLVGVADQGHREWRIISSADWSLNAYAWHWSPAMSPETNNASGLAWFREPTEFKVTRDGQSILFTSGNSGHGLYGGIARMRIGDGAITFWAGGGKNNHSAVEFDDGNIAFVSTTDNILGVFCTDPSASSWPGSVRQVRYTVPLPHGLVWDSVLQRLWVNTNVGVQAFIYSQNPLSPALTQDTAIGTIPFPRGGGGHDLYPILGTARKLMLTCTDDMCILDPDARKISRAQPDKGGIKSMSVDANGRLYFNSWSTNAWWGNLGNSTTVLHPLEDKIYKARVYGAVPS